jgi:hypothetical protein
MQDFGANELKKLLDADISNDLTVDDVLPDRSVLTKEFEDEVDKTMKLFEKEATETIANIASTYIDADYVKSHPYLASKMKLDVKTLAELNFQMYSYQKASMKMLKQISIDDDTHPRYFEVYSNIIALQSKHSVTKSEFLYAMEEAYKKLKNDIETYTPSDKNEIIDVESIDETLEFRGTRKLLQDIRQELSSDQFDPVVYGDIRNPHVNTETGKDIPEELKYPKKANLSEEELEKEVKSVENYFENEEDYWG